MRPDTLLISTAPGERRIALLAGRHLVQVFHDRGADSVEGAVFAGRVTEVNADLGAAFVDIGTGLPGFLGLNDARLPGDGKVKSIKHLVNVGDKVLVQADRDALEGKGPRLTRRLVFKGRYLHLRAVDPGLKFSRFLAREERKGLEELEEFLPDGMGLAFEPATGGAELAALEEELHRLLGMVEELEETYPDAQAPRCLVPAASMLQRALALSAPESRILTDDPVVPAEVERIDPGAEAEIWSGDAEAGAGTPLFDAFGVEEAIEDALVPEVPLPSGGRLIFSETPALVAVDVDSGKATGGTPARLARAVNLEAVKVLARQLRLRGLAGQVVVDFLALKGKKDQQELLGRLKGALAADPVETHVLGFTALGFIEMTRRRTGPSLLQSLTAPCRDSAGTGRVLSPETVALAALRELARRRGARARLRVPRAVSEALKGAQKPVREALEDRLGLKIAIDADATLGPDQYVLETD